jgi:hypothetical protein
VGGSKVKLERVVYCSIRFQTNRCHFFPNSFLNSPPLGFATVLFAGGASEGKPATDRKILQVAQLQLAGCRRLGLPPNNL